MTRRPSRKRSARRQTPVATKRSQTDAFAQDPGRRNFQDAAALLDNRRGRRGIGLAIRAELVRSAENAITSARDRIHEGRTVADNGVSRRRFRNDDDLAAMRLDGRIGHERSCADSGAIDHD